MNLSQLRRKLLVTVIIGTSLVTLDHPAIAEPSANSSQATPDDAGRSVPDGTYFAQATPPISTDPAPVPGVRPNAPPLQPPVLSPPASPIPIEPSMPAPGVPAGAAQSSMGASTLAIQVDAIRIMGNKVVPSVTLYEIAKPYSGRLLEPSEVEALRNALTTCYIKLGFINSGALPPIYDRVMHTLVVNVVEGRLTQIQVRGADRLRPGYVVDRLQGYGDEPLNVNSLGERFQTLLADPLIYRANARLLPGAQPGEAVLDVGVERARPYGLSLFGNNYRPPSVGQSQFGAGGWVRNLTGYGDLLDLTLLQHPGNGSSTGGTVDWHMPFNRGRAEFSLEADRTASSVINAALLPLNIQSESNSFDAGIKDIVYQKSVQLQDTVGLDAIKRTSQTYVLGVPFSFTPGSPSDGRVAESGFRVWNDFTYRTEKEVAVGRLTFTRTESNLTQTKGLPIAYEPIPPHVHYFLFQGQFNRVVLDNGAQAIIKTQLQQSPVRLSPLDQMTIGGLNTVRGFRENELVNDIGRVVSGQFDYPYAFFSAELSGTIGPFVDFGQGKNVGDKVTNISSTGIAWKAAWKGLHFDLSYGHRLTKPAGFSTSGVGLQDHGVELQVSYDVFPKAPAGSQ